MEQSYNIESLVHAKHVGDEWFHEHDVLRMWSVSLEKLLWVVEPFGEAFDQGSSDVSKGGCQSIVQ